MIISAPEIMHKDTALIRAVAFDFDGVFTDNRVILDTNGNELVSCNRYDGYGISSLREAGIHVCVITSEVVPLAAARCKKLGLRHFSACDDKLEILNQWLNECAVGISQVAYLGNDINDLPCLRNVGFPFCPSDAHKSVRPYSTILKTKGGQGVVRELCDMITDARYALHVHHSNQYL